MTASTALAATTRAKPNGKLTPRLAALANSAGLPLTHAAQARALSLPAKGAGSLLRRGDRILVDVRVASTSPASVRKLAAAGARIVHVSRQYLTVTAAVAPQQLRSLAAVAGVVNVQEVLAPMISGAGSTDGGTTATATCPSGAVRTEGDVQLKAGAARTKYGVSGTGIKVGVLSDSYDENAGAATHAAQDVANGDLPGTGNPCGHTTPVHVIADETSGTGEDEGRAMLQVVHDLAPASPLAYATAFDGLTSFASNIQALKTDGAKVIVDDISYFVEPFFQNGPIGVAVNQVAAGGVNYFSSAANSNVIVGGHNVASWEAPAFRTGACPAGLPSSFHCMDFNPTATVDGGYGVTLAPGGGFNLDLQWSEPWFGVKTDIDVYVANSAGTLLAGSEDINPGASGTQKPFEFFGYQNTTGATQNVNIVINRFSFTGAGTPRLKMVMVAAGGIAAVQYNTSSGGDVVGPTIFGHNGSTNMMSVAAVPFDNSATIEDYSSRGPVTYYWGPVNGTTPAAKLTTPSVLAKPDIAATDGGQTTFFAQNIGGVWRFYGTSESAPHAGAVAALIRDGFASATVAQVVNAEKTTAVAVGTFGADAMGSGLVNALGAVAKLLPAATIGDVSVTEGNSGTKLLTFTVTLNRSNTRTMSLRYATKNLTATAGSDYVAKTGTLLFAPGQVSKPISITIIGDTTHEANETFGVVLSKSVRMKFADSVGVGTITNDDL